MANQHRIAMGIQYQGQAYHGWQSQEVTTETVQAKLEKALSKLAAEPIRVTCAGRTDKGVHALGQVVHFNTQAIRDEKAWIIGTNSFLPADIAVIWIKKVDENFHARFSAKARSYRYLIYNHRARSPLWGNLTTHHPRPLHADLMHEAAQYLMGEHDFTSFRGAACQARHPVREIQAISVARRDNLITVDVKANAFLHNMVRNIVGVLLEVGRLDRKPEWAREVLQIKDRKQAGVTAPPQGLYLVRVDY